MVRMKLIASILLTLVASGGGAQEHQHGNGEKLGTVHFATSCNVAAQKEFNRAVALLHSFQSSRAIEGFQAVLREDSTCGIAYWGIALSDWSNPFAPGQKDTRQLQLGRQSAEQGKTLGARTDRERSYLEAVSKLYGDFEHTPQQIRLLAYRDAAWDTGRSRLKATLRPPRPQGAKIRQPKSYMLATTRLMPTCKRDRTRPQPGL